MLQYFILGNCVFHLCLSYVPAGPYPPGHVSITHHTVSAQLIHWRILGSKNQPSFVKSAANILKPLVVPAP
jgi:hypothetical protein